ncbi:MAG TPA: ammonium transporter [Tepidisphaeraceae bacterium]|nr:ammonium transporter [Tepidisphaeraceae bacterium]
MSSSIRIGRVLPGVFFLTLLIAVADLSAQAIPDPNGAFSTTPTAVSVPNYTVPAPGPANDAEWNKPEALAKNLQAVARQTSSNYYSINFIWVLGAAFLVMFMQAGFALIETGLCRAKNAAHSMSLNFLIYAIGITGFFICGFAFMCGGVNGTSIGGPASLGGLPTLDQMVTVGDGWGILGKTGFFLSGSAYDARVAVWFLFMMVFMDTTATIPTGACAERLSFKSFFLFSLFIGMFTFPVFACWVWGGGWLAQLGPKLAMAHGAVDFAGAGVVHLQGGVIALVLTSMLGPRIGKYDSKGNPQPIIGHDVPMVLLGTLILAFGWFGMNCGNALGASDGRIAIIAVNTALSSGAATLTACLLVWCFLGKPDPSLTSNGMLAGLVAISGPCAFVSPASAFLIGIVAGILVITGIFVIEKAGIDDAVGAVSVHGINGLWGLIALGLLADGTYGAGWNGCHLFRLTDGSLGYFNDVAKAPAGAIEMGITGLFYGNGKQLVVELILAAVAIIWNAAMAAIIFGIVGKATRSNRVSPEVEIAGLDIPEMGAPGYPDFINAVAPEQVQPSEYQ